MRRRALMPTESTAPVPEPPGGRVGRWIRQSAGWALIVLGLIGLVVPVLQGVLFLFLGLSMLSADSAWARRLLRRLKRRQGERPQGSAPGAGEAGGSESSRRGCSADPPMR
jgi:uncharacterized protein